MKTCDRCRVAGCMLTYRGEACAAARGRECPDVKVSNAELLCDIPVYVMSSHIAAFIQNHAAANGGGIPSTDDILAWLKEDAE